MTLPPGYLAPANVALGRNVDGDTAHFVFPSFGDRSVRFLYVNTEEAYGAEATEFGIETARRVAAILSGTWQLVVVPRESRSRPGTADLDPYDRWLALVFVDGELFETYLVREGLSAYYTQFGCAPEPIHSALVYAEAEARANERGIWRPGHPTDYREVLARWMGSNRCRPNPFVEPYCR
jgi:micrococcal nuclease